MKPKINPLNTKFSQFPNELNFTRDGTLIFIVKKLKKRRHAE